MTLHNLNETNWKDRCFLSIGERIKAVRTAVGITQVKFAERIAVATSYVSESENAVREPNERAIRLICAEFNVNENWLRTGQGSMYNEEDSASVSESMKILKAFNQDFQDDALEILKILQRIYEKNKSLHTESPQKFNSPSTLHANQT
jgi:transcriptional regulator with XRE-family HTH domain